MRPGDERDAGEHRLVQSVCQTGDQRAFEQLIQLFQSPVRSFLRRLTDGDTARADDLAQEAFFKAYCHISSFRGDGRFLSWLFKIAYQQFANDLRRQKRDPPIEPDHDLSRHPRDNVSPDASLSVDEMLGPLKADERAAILLCYRFGLTHTEIADNMGIPLGTAKTLIRRGKEKMYRFHQGALS